jgi:hypothetical protein
MQDMVPPNRDTFLVTDLPAIWWTPLSGLALCLFGGDIQEGGMKPLTIVVSFDGGEQVVPGDIPGWVESLVHAFRFQSAEAAFHRSVVLSNFPSGAWMESSRPHQA